MHQVDVGDEIVGFDCNLVNSYSQVSKPLALKDVFMGSPYSPRTSVCVVFPLINCPATVAPVASAMLSLPELMHPARTQYNESEMTTVERIRVAFSQKRRSALLPSTSQLLDFGRDPPTLPCLDDDIGCQPGYARAQRRQIPRRNRNPLRASLARSPEAPSRGSMPRWCG